MQIHIKGHQREAHAGNHRPGFWIEGGWPFVGQPGRVFQLLFQCFVLTLADLGQCGTLGTGRCIFVIIDRYPQLANEFAELSGNFNGILRLDATYRDEGHNIHSAHPGVRSLMFGHVDEFKGFCRHCLGCLEGWLWFPQVGEHRTIMIPIGIDVQDLDPIHLANLVENLFDDVKLSPLADVWLA